MGRIIDINGPNNTYDTETESTPVSGVDTKNAVVALFEAPARLNPIAAGITPHEHKGIGAPIKAAFTVVKKPSYLNVYLKNLPVNIHSITQQSANQALTKGQIIKITAKNY
jgi:hypothetical protein|tara:strand:+ start:8479 stop:8811 length:333 start_codon:yes stop_codon:yes gene_type:complete